MYLGILRKPLKVEKIHFLIKYVLFALMYIVDVLIRNCICVECRYVYLLLVYTEVFLSVVLWNKLYICKFDRNNLQFSGNDMVRIC